VPRWYIHLDAAKLASACWETSGRAPDQADEFSPTADPSARAAFERAGPTPQQLAAIKRAHPNYCALGVIGPSAKPQNGRGRNWRAARERCVQRPPRRSKWRQQASVVALATAAVLVSTQTALAAPAVNPATHQRLTSNSMVQRPSGGYEIATSGETRVAQAKPPHDPAPPRDRSAAAELIAALVLLLLTLLGFATRETRAIATSNFVVTDKDGKEYQVVKGRTVPEELKQGLANDRYKEQRVRYFRTLYVGLDNRWSTSKIQPLLWTYAVLFGLSSLLIAKWLGTPQGWTAQVKAGLQDEYLILLGGPFAAAVLAKFITTEKIRNETLPKTVAPEDSGGLKDGLVQVISDDAGNTDLVDLQYFAFNLLALAYFLSVFVFHLQEGFPHLPALLVGLTGVAGATYVSKKAAERALPVLTSVVPGKAAPGGEVDLWGANLVVEAPASPAPPGWKPKVTVAGVTADELDVVNDAPATDHLKVRIPDAPAGATKIVAFTAVGTQAGAGLDFEVTAPTLKGVGELAAASCADLRVALEDVESEIRGLQEELAGASPGEKPSIVRQIRSDQAQADRIRQQQRASNCLPAPPQWHLAAEDSQVLAVHAALLPSAKVLYFSGDQHDEEPTRPLDATRLWNPETESVEHVDSPGDDADLFCCGHSLLGDGSVLVVGGTSAFDHEAPKPHSEQHHFTGLKSTHVYDWRTNSWAQAEDMRDGRWYPTIVTLSDGRALAMSGHNAGGEGHENSFLEFYNPDTRTWTPRPDDEAFITSPPLEETGYFKLDTVWIGPIPIPLNHEFHPMVYYPRLHLLPNGEIFSSTALQADDGSNHIRLTRTINPVDGALTVVGPPPFTASYMWPTPPWIPDPQGVGRMANVYARQAFVSVMLPLKPPNFTPKILICGEEQAKIFDCSRPDAGWQNAGSPRPYPMRAYANSVILPNGTVLIIGGAASEHGPFGAPTPSSLQEGRLELGDTGGTDDDAILSPEVYHPDTNTWETLAPDPNGIARIYHSVALLLPDGRVWLAGSNHDAQRNVGGTRVDGGGDARELRIQTLSPSYLFAWDTDGKNVVPAAKPRITEAPEDISYNEEFIISTPDAGEIATVALIRCASTTHGFSSDQRYVELIRDRSKEAPASLDVRAPETSLLAPPGYYMLFLVNQAGTPSIAHFVRLGTS